MPYITPEGLNGEPYISSSDIYSLGVVMAELSSGKPPFYNKKHDLSLALAICNGLRPEFGKDAPEFYKKLVYKCMNANPNERPTAEELHNIVGFWHESIRNENEEEENSVIKETKLKQDLKKLIKKYQISQLHTRRIQMLYILIEHLHLVIYYQNLLIHPLLLHILVMKNSVPKILTCQKFLFNISSDM
ncbi:kinase-like domain-containing protein [Rhizophagus diaphanus]|nr:kinase-like domain-containing protein [Rhizophagus diaphanus] [Rhizophagus sp. MUCL 43196]